MARFVVDCGVVPHLASEEIEVAAEHELLAPTNGLSRLGGGAEREPEERPHRHVGNGVGD
jgi:hypothetical protein